MYVDASEAADSDIDKQQNLGRDIGFFVPIRATIAIVACCYIDLIDQLTKDDSNERERYACCDGSYSANKHQYLVEPCRVCVEEEMEKAK